MFEDSLVESIGRIRTHSRRYAAGTTVLEIALLAVLVLIPYLYPSELPSRYLNVPLISPPPPLAAPVQSTVVPARAVESLSTQLIAPSHIPSRIARVADQPPGPIKSIDAGQGPTGAPGVPWAEAGVPAPLPQVRLAKPAGPVRVSSGVAQGQLLAPIRPQYPAIAEAARVQGTVVLAATISTEGRIENLRVLGGPPLLVSAAVDAVRQARYRPFLLNGQPVEVQTTLSVEFRLDGY